MPGNEDMMIQFSSRLGALEANEKSSADAHRMLFKKLEEMQVEGYARESRILNTIVNTVAPVDARLRAVEDEGIRSKTATKTNKWWITSIFAIGAPAGGGIGAAIAKHLGWG